MGWGRPQVLRPVRFRTPEGRLVRVGTMANALRVIRQNPGAYYPGWEWFSVPGYFILSEVRRGMHERINWRAHKPGGAEERIGSHPLSRLKEAEREVAQ